MTTVSVFGLTGFLGRRLVRRLAAEGATVRIAVRSADRARSVLRAAEMERVTVVRTDVRDQASVAAAVAGADAVTGTPHRVQVMVLERPAAGDPVLVCEGA